MNCLFILFYHFSVEKVVFFLLICLSSLYSGFNPLLVPVHFKNTKYFKCAQKHGLHSCTIIPVYKISVVCYVSCRFKSTFKWDPVIAEARCLSNHNLSGHLFTLRVNSASPCTLLYFYYVCMNLKDM